MLMVIARLVLGRLQPSQGWVHARDVARLVSVVLIWLYIAIIGLPAPAARAAVMGTALIWVDSRGARTPPLYVLLITALAMLAWSPGQLYDVSFQLSFLAYGFLALALRLCGAPPVRKGAPPLHRWLWHGLWLCWVNLAATAVVTLGLWPLIAARFGTFSWLVLAGNLLLVPIMGGVILPGAMVALAVAGLFLASPPESWLERAVFGSVELALKAWLWALRWLDRWGDGAVFRVSADWSAWEGIFYYLTLVALLTIVIRLRSKALRQAILAEVPPSRVL
jgi:ComEC/Rec2-related protein